MSGNGTEGTARAFEAKALAQVLTQDRDLMERFKGAAEQGLIRAARSGNKNFTVVDDADIVSIIRAAEPGLKAHSVDPTTGQVVG